MPDNLKDTLTSNHVASIGALAKQAKDLIEKAKKIDADEAADLAKASEVIDARLKNLVPLIAKAPLDHKDYIGTKEAVTKLFAEAKKLAATMEARDAGPKVAFVWKGGPDQAGEKEVIAFIKRHLPSSGHGNISQSLNDVVLGRGKATTGAAGVKHASAGPQQKGKGCTLFFKRSDAAVELIAIGQHEEVQKGKPPKYFIHWSSLSSIPKDKVLEL
jgi:hypothetical protein